MTDVVSMSELALMGDLVCPYCGKNISKYPIHLRDAVLKSECGECYYHLKCFRQLCNEADETDPSSLQCMKCNAILDPIDCKYADDLLTGETKLLEPKKFYAHAEPDGGGKRRKTRKRRKKRKRGAGKGDKEIEMIKRNTVQAKSPQEMNIEAQIAAGNEWYESKRREEARARQYGQDGQTQLHQGEKIGTQALKKSKPRNWFKKMASAAKSTFGKNKTGNHFAISSSDANKLYKQIYMNQSSKQGGKKTKRKRKGGRKRKTRKKRGGNYIEFEDLENGKTYDVTFNDLFINDINNDKMSKHMTNVLFEKMPAHQEGYFKLKFIHQEDGEEEEHVLYEGTEYGRDRLVYATRESGSRAGVSADAGGGRKTKKKTRKKRKRKGGKKGKTRRRKIMVGCRKKRKSKKN